MRKIIFLSIVSFLLLQSCSSSDTSSTSSSLILVKKIIETNPDGVFTTNCTYSGNKIVTGTFTGIGNGTSLTRVGNYTYSGDLITKVEIFENNNLIEKSNYNYNSDNRLASFIELDYTLGIGKRMTYSYNPDGSISSTGYSGDLVSQNTLVSNNAITFSNGEVSSHIEHIGSVTKTLTFTYDNNNCPFKNVLGFDKISYAVIGTFTSEISHNLIQIVRVQNGAPNYTTDFQYTYNSNNFPLTKSETFGGITNQTSQYFY